MGELSEIEQLAQDQRNADWFSLNSKWFKGILATIAGVAIIAFSSFIWNNVESPKGQALEKKVTSLIQKDSTKSLQFELLRYSVNEVVKKQDQSIDDAKENTKAMLDKIDKTNELIIRLMTKENRIANQ